MLLGKYYIIYKYDMTVSEALLQVAELTKKNLQILQVLNDSFYTKKNHLTTTVGNTTYTIPSYIALENKVNHLQDALNNLVHASKCGEAWFNFDGNSREVCVRGYQTAPNPITLSPQDLFYSEDTFLFKDMLTPQPYLDFELNSLSDDINKVVVKKIIPYNTTLKQVILSNITDGLADEASALVDYSTIIKCLSANENGDEYVKGTDYQEYDTVYDLPVRTCNMHGQYVIENVLESKINEDLAEVIKIRVSSLTPLKVHSFDNMDSRNLQEGDILITYDGSAKVIIESITKSSRELTLRVLSGEYVNPIGSGEVNVPAGSTIFDVVSDYSKLQYFAQPNEERKLHIPLEEDQYVYIAVAPLNPRLNVQSEWGKGLMLNVDNLKNESNTGFRKYYNDNVNNIGDALTEFASIMFPSITKYSSSQFEEMIQAPDSVDSNSPSTIQVYQINKHMDESESVQTIRSLYAQKKQYQNDLSEIQSKILSLTSELSQISFDDMTGTRSQYTAAITDLKEQQNQISSSISKITDQIARAANDALIPLEDAKYRIRGYVDVENFVQRFKDWNKMDNMNASTVADLQASNLRKMRANIIGTQTRYRYKNPDTPNANVNTINDFLFTDWTIYEPPTRERSMRYSDGKYIIINSDSDNESFNYTENAVKFNQIDIPISQGEIVELQTRIIWGFGYPFVTVATKWSESTDVEFPVEFTRDVQVTQILEENNNDIETNRFTNILKEKGITDHVDDKVQDQDIIYFHKPENISSGFYTQERRIIPLRDKLQEINNNIVEIQDTLLGTTAEALTVSFVADGITNVLQPDVNNTVHLPAYNTVAELGDNIPSGSAYKTDGMVYTTGLISLTNNTSRSLRIFSMFPGARDLAIKDLQHTKFNKGEFEYAFPKNASGASIQSVDSDVTIATPSPANEYENVTGGYESNNIIKDNPYDIRIITPAGDWDSSSMNPVVHPQSANQIITYRSVNPFDYSRLDIFDDYTKTHNSDGSGIRTDKSDGLHVYPISSNRYGMCMSTDATNAYIVLAPGETITFPVGIEYKLSTAVNKGTFTIGFNVRNSLYNDALYYQVQLVAKQIASTADTLNSAKQSINTLTNYNTTVR